MSVESYFIAYNFRKPFHHFWIVTTTALVGLSLPLPTFAQGAADAAPPGASGGLEEIIVTATKRLDSVNKVPLSIVALPQNALVEQELRSVQDISRAVPGLFVTTGNTANGAAVSVRGIASGLGAPTTAVYLDDVPLQKRISAGATSGSGTPFPQLYDLDRVEILKGPQGTLYGESSEGGAIRFITPTPSLTTYSGTARVEVASTEDGGISNEEGFALGGPIVPDVLGFRASAWMRRDAGYVDHVYAYTGQTLAYNTNSENRWLARLSLLWAPTDDLRITPAFYISRDHFADLDSFTENTPAFTVPKTVSGVPAHTYGPLTYGPYKTIANCNIGQNFANTIPACYRLSPRTTQLNVPSLTIDYDFEDFSIHSSTAYATDVSKGLTDASMGDVSSINGGVGLLYALPYAASALVYDNARHTATEELRVTSAPNDGRWTWVGGVFASNQDTHQRSQDYSVNYDAVVQYTKNTTTLAIYGAPVGPDGGISARDQKIRETEYAAFGEVTYKVFEDLKALVGLRAARDEIKYYGYLQGPFFGDQFPSFANGGLSGGHQFATALLPKFNLEYQLGEGQMVYATASKGERVGGVNTGPFYSKCQSTFANLGITGTPGTYDPDTLWNYEVGGKIRTLGGKAQINASLFYVDWSNVQVTYTLPSPCGFSYVANAGGAISKGGDIQAQIEVINDLTLSLNASYTDAYYSTAVTGPAPTFRTFINKGDTLPVPPLSIDIGVRYALPVFDEYKAYIRADYQYNSAYKRGFGPGASSYNADTYRASQTQYVTARLGGTIDDFEVALFVDNLFNSQAILSRVGGRSCSNATCTTFTANNPIFTDSTFRPRTFGLNVNYKFGGGT